MYQQLQLHVIQGPPLCPPTKVRNHKAVKKNPVKLYTAGEKGSFHSTLMKKETSFNTCLRTAKGFKFANESMYMNYYF
jgi:hypothetical protein